ncbi:hypothetical protein GCM10020295_02440 [Streptomyces cinereospinus]
MESRKRTHAGGLTRSAPAGTVIDTGRRALRSTDGGDVPAWPSDTEVWNWAQSVTQGEYGPPPSFPRERRPRYV